MTMQNLQHGLRKPPKISMTLSKFLRESGSIATLFLSAKASSSEVKHVVHKPEPLSQNLMCEQLHEDIFRLCLADAGFLLGLHFMSHACLIAWRCRVHVAMSGFLESLANTTSAPWTFPCPKKPSSQSHHAWRRDALCRLTTLSFMLVFAEVRFTEAEHEVTRPKYAWSLCLGF